MTNRAVFMMSAVKNKGNIIYADDNFRDIMEIKSEFSLTNSIENEGLIINHLILPCWIEKHNEAMQSLDIYEKPSNHIG